MVQAANPRPLPCCLALQKARSHAVIPGGFAGGKTKGGAFARLSAGRRSALSPPRATRTTEKVRSGHRFSSGDPRTPLFDPNLVACTQVRGARGGERTRGARREARRATCSWSRRAAGRTPQPTSGATRVTGGGKLGLGRKRRWIGWKSRGQSHDPSPKPSSSARTTRARTLVALGHLRDAGSPRCAYLRRQRGGS